MHALFLILNKTDQVEDVLNALVKVGVKGATIIDSQGMGSAMVSNNSEQAMMFGTFRKLFDREHPYNKTIFTVIETDELLDSAVKAIQETVGLLDKPNEGLMFTVPVGNVYGMAKYK